MKERGMTKAIITFGYTSYVMDTRDALALTEMLGKAEVYEQKYGRGENKNTHHIYENESEFGTIKLITDSFYQMAKLAGKPEQS